MTWPAEFEEILRRHLPMADGPVSADELLADLGLDSLAMVNLVMDLEEGMGISVPDERLVSETFKTAGAVWAAVADLPVNSDASGGHHHA
ncbi:acyl carrier protein [Kitasatospora sp. NPDC059811]|uniref:acyl carrier protein n=1 Tax=Streptomycetaceae TaxID=2062 RepID=UPI0007AFACC3|nr:acyl carrier protein [Streptomyces sp. MJM8645]